jgi:hydrogenase small subunit
MARTVESEDSKKLLEQSEKVAEHLDLPDDLLGDVHEHLEELHEGRAPVIWIQGQNCTGCTVTLLNSEHYHPGNPGFMKVSLRYQPNLMSAEGSGAIDLIEETESEYSGKYILVLEGAIPTGEGERFCTFGLTEETKQVMGRTMPDDRTVFDWLVELIPGAKAVLAVGNCAAFGGIPMMEAQVTGATSATDVVEAIDSGKPVVNVSGCPPHPDWIVGTLVELLLWLDEHKDAPVLDDKMRLKRFYEGKIHDVCERRKAFEEKRFLEDWNDSTADEDRCLLKMGCKGPSTHADCPTRKWNAGAEWCVAVNAPCHGCVEPDFQNRLPRPR